MVSDNTDQSFSHGLPSRDPSPRAGRTVRTLGCGALLGLGIAAAASFVIVILNRDPLPELTRPELQAALERWQAHRPPHYIAEISVRGQRPSQIRIEVRAGRPISFTLNGTTPKNPETAEFWTLENLLTVVEEEFDAANDDQKRAPHFNIPRKARVYTRALFDAEYGYPRRYRRSSPDAHIDLDWTVEKFESLRE